MAPLIKAAWLSELKQFANTSDNYNQFVKPSIYYTRHCTCHEYMTVHEDSCTAWHIERIYHDWWSVGLFTDWLLNYTYLCSYNFVGARVICHLPMALLNRPSSHCIRPHVCARLFASKWTSLEFDDDLAWFNCRMSRLNPQALFINSDQ